MSRLKRLRKNYKRRHSERSEESLFGLNPRKARKEGFLASLGMTGKGIFSAACEAATHKDHIGDSF